MLIAIPEWNRRVSPVFDEAHYFRIFKVDSGILLERGEIELTSNSQEQRISELSSLQINTIICGAISNYTLQLAEAANIAVMPFIAGEVEQVLTSWLSGNWQQECCFMPGCGRRQHRRERGCGQRGRGRRINNHRR